MFDRIPADNLLEQTEVECNSFVEYTVAACSGSERSIEPEVVYFEDNIEVENSADNTEVAQPVDYTEAVLACLEENIVVEDMMAENSQVEIELVLQDHTLELHRVFALVVILQLLYLIYPFEVQFKQSPFYF